MILGFLERGSRDDHVVAPFNVLPFLLFEVIFLIAQEIRLSGLLVPVLIVGLKLRKFFVGWTPLPVVLFVFLEMHRHKFFFLALLLLIQLLEFILKFHQKKRFFGLVLFFGRNSALVLDLLDIME